MKALFLGFLILCAQCARAQGWTEFSFHLVNVPGMYIWDNGSDPSETGSPTVFDHGSQPYTISFQGGGEFGLVRRVDDTIFFSDLDYPYSLTIVLDSTRSIAKSIQYYYTEYTGANHLTEFRIENIPLFDTNHFITMTLVGSQLHGHNFFYQTVTDQFGFDQFSYDTTRTIGVGDDSSSIEVSISDQQIVSEVNYNRQNTNSLICFPLPASSKLNIILPQPFEGSLSLNDFLGRSLISTFVTPGTTELQFDVSSLSSNVYYLRTRNEISKIIIQK